MLQHTHFLDFWDLRCYNTHMSQISVISDVSMVISWKAALSTSGFWRDLWSWSGILRRRSSRWRSWGNCECELEKPSILLGSFTCWRVCWGWPGRKRCWSFRLGCTPSSCSGQKILFTFENLFDHGLTSWSPNSTVLHLDIYLLSWWWGALWAWETFFQGL